MRRSCVRPTSSRAISSDQPARGRRMTAFADALSLGDGRVTLVELVPWAGPRPARRRGPPSRAGAEDSPRTRASPRSTVTDNAGGHVRLSPLTARPRPRGDGRRASSSTSRAATAAGRAHEPRLGARERGPDRRPGALRRLPVEGYGGLSRAGLRHRLGRPAGAARRTSSADGARLPRRLRRQPLQAARERARAAAAEAGHEGARRARGSPSPRSAGTSAPGTSCCAGCAASGVDHARSRRASTSWARRRRATSTASRVPGVHHDRPLLMDWSSARRPRRTRAAAAFLELAAMQVAVARGLGFRGRLPGRPAQRGRDRPGARRWPMATGPDDWRGARGRGLLPRPGTFRLFGTPTAGDLATDEPARIRPVSDPEGPPARAARVPLAYQAHRARPRLRARLARLRARAGVLRARRARWRLRRPLHVLEQVAKVPLFECRDCGDCSLPEIAYLCPESQCVKNQRNGPCGGTHDGECEVPGKPCIWAARLRPAQALRGGADDARPGAGRSRQRPARHERLGEHVPRPRPPVAPRGRQDRREGSS